MRKITFLIAALAFISLNSKVFAQWQTNGSNIYYNSGNVGIGTDSPSEALSIDGNLKLLTQTSTSPVISSNNGLSFDSGNDWAGIHFTVGQHVDYTKGFHVRNYDLQTLFYIETNGNVGIGTGTSNPSEKLEVNGKIKSSGSNSALILVSPDGTEWEITIDNSGNLSAAQSTKVLEIENNNEVNVYPNPTDNIIKVEFEYQTNQEINVELYDLTGKLIFLKSYTTDNVVVDLNDFNSGNYLLKVKDDEGNILSSEKVVKQ